MKYSISTIVKYEQSVSDMINFYMSVPIEELHLCISEGNEKIGHALNVSLPAVITCPNCEQCKFFCYDIRDCYIHGWDGDVIKARARNYVILLKDREKYFSELETAIQNRKSDEYFRWHVGGEIKDADYFHRMVELAKKYPHFFFWTYTKNYGVVNHYVREHGNDRHIAIPKNFVIMFSEWDGMPLINPYGFPIFCCKLKKGNKNRDAESFTKMWRCPGNCDICKAAKRGCMVGENTYADEH